MSSREAAAAAALILLTGLMIRLPNLDAPPLDFHPTRQYRSALIARADSPAAMSALSAEEQTAAIAMRAGQGAIEPEVMEAIAVASYQVLGREDLRVPRVVSVLSWLLVAGAIGWLLRLITTPWPPVLVAMGFILFVPFGVGASRAFMPDPLMTSLAMLSLAVTVWHHGAPTRGRGLARVVIAAAAIGIKPMALFFVAPAMLALDLRRVGGMRGLFSGLLTCLAASIPAAVYYMTLIQAGNPVADARIVPELLRRPSFWVGWGEMISRVVGWPAFALSLAAIVLSKGAPRVILTSTWLGYAVFGLLFTHHISTHDYYSLPLVPLVAASIAVLIDHAARRLPPDVSRFAAPTVAVVVLAALVPAFRPSRLYGDVGALRRTAGDYERIGTLVSHSRRVVSLDGSYGYPLSYHARIVTSQLPLSGDRAIFDLTGRTDIPVETVLGSGDYFVGTLQPELDAQPDLRSALETRHPLIERGGTPASWRYLVYDLRRYKVTASPERLSLFTRLGTRAEASTVVDVWAPGSAAWRAESSPMSNGVRLEPTAGVGPGQIRVTAEAGAAGDDHTIVVSLFSGEGLPPSGIFAVRVRTLPNGPNQAPFGWVDSPPDPIAAGAAPIVVQGWALDDLSLARVVLVARDADGGETTLGEARLGGYRPDVVAAHPAAHDTFRAAWAFTLLPKHWQKLKAPITIIVRAIDSEGLTTEIGRRQIR